MEKINLSYKFKLLFGSLSFLKSFKLAFDQ